MRCILGWISILGTAAFATIALFGQIPKPDALTVNVPANSNPYLAGLPAGTKARVGDEAPQQSPVLIERTLSHAVAVTFTAVGAIQHTPECPPDCYGPNGAELARHRGGAEHGISDVIAPMNALIGVFLTDDRPDRSDTPRPIDYRAIRRDNKSFSPQVKQVFLSATEGQAAALPADTWCPQKQQGCILPSWMAMSGTITLVHLP